MKNKQRGFVSFIIIGAVLVLLIGGGTYLYNKSPKYKTSPESQIVKVDNKKLTECKTDVSEFSILCNLRNAYMGNSQVATIRLQGALSEYYDSNKANLAVLTKEIINKDNPTEYRIFLIHLLQNRSARKDWTVVEFANVNNSLVAVISNKNDVEKVRIEMITNLPKIYYYVGEKNTSNLFSALLPVLNTGTDALSSAVAGSLSGAAADLDLQKVKEVMINFAANYMNNYKERPQTLLMVLTTLKYNKETSPDVEKALKYVCSQNNPRAAMLCNG
jgi:hypothetical protein